MKRFIGLAALLVIGLLAACAAPAEETVVPTGDGPLVTVFRPPA